jgi:hypothetical protein
MADDELIRDRDGDLYPAPAQHSCEDGWLGEDVDGRPRPCPVCRGHLRRRRGVDGLSGWTSKRDLSGHGRSSDLGSGAVNG